MNNCEYYYSSPIGYLKITGNELGICELNFTELTTIDSQLLPPICLLDCIKQLNEYFAGKRKIFQLKLILTGTDFQKQVWNTLQKIPYGTTASYLEIALMIENPKSMRAVGMANNRNKIPIIIPCHRVIGSNGKMVGFGGGIWRKEWLLKHEQNVLF